MVHHDFGPGTVCDLIHQSLRVIKGSNKNLVILWKKTALTPTINNDMRWSSASNMMDRYEKLEDHIKLMSLNKNAKFFMPPSSPSPRFQLAAKNTMLMLQDINAVMVYLQERLLPMHECHELQEWLILTVQKGKVNEDSHWYLSDYRDDYISIRSDSHKLPNKIFVSAVCKMQKQQGSTLTPAQKLATSTWRTKPCLPVVTNNNGNGLSLADQLKNEHSNGKRKSKEPHASSNDDRVLDHVIGSAAKVEGLWSVAKHILTETYNGMHPIVFESILFLHFNKSLWDELTVVEALGSLREAHREERLKKKLEETIEEDE
jgi:hypothetical protein